MKKNYSNDELCEKLNVFYFSILPSGGGYLTITRFVIFNSHTNDKLIKNLEVSISENAAYILQRPMLKGVTSCLLFFFFRLPIRPYRIIGGGGHEVQTYSVFSAGDIIPNHIWGYHSHVST